jgi:hypothetical protein
MQYVLGNMLNGAGGLNPDGLALDLQFAADKTLTARKGPTPTFTRGSGATEVGSDGLIRYAPENLTLQSNNFASASWQKINGATIGSNASDPFGGNSATQISFASTADSRIEQSASIAVGTRVTVSFWARAESNTQISTRLWTELYSTFNVTTSWQRFSHTTTITAGASPQINNRNLGAKTIDVYGFQLERHGSARDYIPTTTSAVYAPRFDHDSAGVCRGLLIEESRTNTLWPSDNFASSQWNASSLRNITVSIDNTTSPSGATDADRLTVGATTTTYSVVQNTITLTSGTVYAYSAFVKANEVTRVALWAGNTTTLQVDAVFDLTGSGSVVANSFGTASIQSFGNGWFRCIVSGAAGANSSTSLRISPASGTSKNYPGNSVDSFWAWGAQLETGSFATSYIPTTNASVVRSADVCSIGGTNFSGMWNANEGTLYASFYPYRSTLSGGIVSAGRAGTTAGRIQIGRVGTTRATFEIADDSNAIGFSYLNATLLPFAKSKAALAYKQNDCMGTVNSGGSDLDTSVTLGTQNELLIGGFHLASRPHSGAIDSIRIYRKRLPLAKLQALTA